MTHVAAGAAPSAAPEHRDSADPLPTVARRASRLEHAWWGAIVTGLGALNGARPLSDNSFLTHLATGRLIRAGHTPHTDPYTFTAAGRPWVVQSWLASWWYGTLEALGGGAAIRLFVVALSGLLAWMVWRLSAPAELLVGRLVITAGALIVGLFWWNERPQLIGMVALAAAAIVVTERRSPAWLLPLFGVWVNVHGSFPIGLAFLGAWAGLTTVLARRIDGRGALGVAAAIGGTVMGAVVSPFGFDLITFPVEMLKRSATLIFITEWRPLALDSLASIVFLAVSVGVAAAIAQRRSWPRLAVIGLFLGLALWAVRNVVPASIVLVPVAAPALAGMGALRVGAPVAWRRMLPAAAAVVAALTALVAVTDDYEVSAYPVAMADRIEATPRLRQGRVLSYDYVGNFLEWRSGAGRRVWLDDRAEVVPRAVVVDYVRLLSGIGKPGVILDRQPHDLVLWNAKGEIADYLRRSDEYTVVAQDREWILVERVGSLPPA